MFADLLNLTGTLSARKILNITLVRLSYYLSVMIKKPLVWGRPFFISLEPAAVCGLACPQCPTGAGDISREQPYLDVRTFQAIVDEIAGTTAILSLYNQGEPLMHRSFTEMVRYASERRIYTVTSTNGQLLTKALCRRLVEAGLDRIIVSLDGTDQESYARYRRGGDLGKAVRGIRWLSGARQSGRKPMIIAQFLVFRHNQEQVPEMKKFGYSLGADRVRIKTAQIVYPDEAGHWLPDQAKYSRYRRNDRGRWTLGIQLPNRCKRLWQATVITTDGIVVPCCFDKLAEYPMGDLHSGSLRKIWKNQDYNDFRAKVLRQREKIAICLNCTEGTGRIYR